MGKRDDREALRKVVTTKIQTTMIGALSAIEEILSPIINQDGHSKALYEKCRQRILDNGNQQKRNVDKELELYNIERIMYTYNMKVRPLREDRYDE